MEYKAHEVVRLRIIVQLQNDQLMAAVAAMPQLLCCVGICQ